MAWREMQPSARPRDPIKELIKPRTMSEVLGNIGDDDLDD